MESNQIVTVLLATVVIGYGVYMLVKSVGKQVKGDCSGCSYRGGKSCNCSAIKKK